MRTSKFKNSEKDPLEVVCRIRPVNNADGGICLKAKDSQTLILFNPDSAQRHKEVHYSFKEVFDVDTTQKDIFDRIALPLIEGLLHGMNGLIFTYGITSSGKTHTMTGSPNDGGILPRSLDVLFNSIADCSTPKFIFKPDRMNGFDVQSMMESKLDQQKERRNLNRAMKTPRKEKTVVDRVPYPAVVSQVPPDVKFAVFISYVEIYNNYIYDLLDETPLGPNKKTNLNSKMLREDAMHNMYVFGVTESEVKTVDEALELFNKGLFRRKVSHTALNSESSRSHSIFTIRIVQAPLDHEGAEVLLDKDFITVSQLSLVDLAGSERNVRTKTRGTHMREAGNINSSLMTLRNCLDALRDIQNQVYKKIPYRESKLTHLFKTYFEGQGKIKMIVCVNPSGEYYDETVHVMKFAEMAQDVLIARPESVSTPIQAVLVPGRGKMYHVAAKKAKEEGVSIASILSPTVYSLGPDFPNVPFVFEESSYVHLMEFLEARITRRNYFIQDLNRKQEDFRTHLNDVMTENSKLIREKSIFASDLACREHQIVVLENKLLVSEERAESVGKQLSTVTKELDNAMSKINAAKKTIANQAREMDKIKRVQEKIASDKDRLKTIMARRLAEKQAELERKMCFTDEKFRQLREILNTDDWDFLLESAGVPITIEIPSEYSGAVSPRPASFETETIASSRNSSSRNILPSKTLERVALSDKENRLPGKGIPVSNPRHRRSRTNSTEKWIEHKPMGNLTMGTILQPNMKRKKSVSELKLRDIMKPDVSKYLLEHQEQDSKGEIKTELYKADIIPSAGGGIQVVYNDVEKLKQASFPAYNLRKRSYCEVFEDIDTRTTDSDETLEGPTKIVKAS